MYKTRVNKGLFDEEFTKERLSAMCNPLEAQALIFNEGQLIEASCTVAPRQRNTREANKTRQRRCIMA